MPVRPWQSGYMSNADEKAGVQSGRYSRFSKGGALKGAIGGGLTGGMIGGLPGALAGAGLGFLGGGIAGGKQDEADATRKQAAQEAIASQERLRRDMADRRQRDLDRTLGFYGPALQALEGMYGIPMSAWGEGLPQNRPQMPTRTGMLPGGQQVSAAPMRTDFLEQMPGARNRIGGGIKPIQGLQELYPMGGMLPVRRLG